MRVSSMTAAPPSREASLSDALLRGNRDTRNAVPFNAEVRAAFAAFAGITDTELARRYWRANVTWDDVLAFKSTGVSVTDETTILTVSREGISAAEWSAWESVFSSLQQNLKELIAQGSLPQTAVSPASQTITKWASTVARLRRAFADPGAYLLLGRMLWMPPDDPDNYYGWASTMFRDMLSDRRSVPFTAQTAAVGEALMIMSASRYLQSSGAAAQRRLSFGGRLPANVRGETPWSATELKVHAPTWVDHLANGMHPLRAAVLIYAGGMSDPEFVENAADRSTRVLAQFATLSTVIPARVLAAANRGADAPGPEPVTGG